MSKSNKDNMVSSLNYHAKNIKMVNSFKQQSSHQMSCVLSLVMCSGPLAIYKQRTCLTFHEYQRSESHFQKPVTQDPASNCTHFLRCLGAC